MADEETKISWIEPSRLRWWLPGQPGVPALVILAIGRAIVGSVVLAFIWGVVVLFDDSKRENYTAVVGIMSGLAALAAVIGTIAAVVVDGDCAVSPEGIERSRNIWYGYEFARWPWETLDAVVVKTLSAGGTTFTAIVLVDRAGQTHYIAVTPDKADEVIRFLTDGGWLNPEEASDAG